MSGADAVDLVDVLRWLVEIVVVPFAVAMAGWCWRLQGRIETVHEAAQRGIDACKAEHRREASAIRLEMAQHYVPAEAMEKKFDRLYLAIDRLTEKVEELRGALARQRAD